jgi:hypothetical protein
MAAWTGGNKAQKRLFSMQVKVEPVPRDIAFTDKDLQLQAIQAFVMVHQLLLLVSQQQKGLCHCLCARYIRKALTACCRDRIPE